MQLYTNFRRYYLVSRTEEDFAGNLQIYFIGVEGSTYNQLMKASMYVRDHFMAGNLTFGEIDWIT